MADRSATVVSTATSEREKAIEQALNQIERRFGKGAIMKLGEISRIHVDVIPTGSIALDLALGVGGIPRGRITEIYGPEASGKTTLGQHIIASAQRAGGYAAFIDAEHALDRTYAARCGIDINNLLISQPDTGEQALEIVDALIRSNAIDVIVIDSVAALTPRAEIEGEMGDSHVGLQARLMSQAMRSSLRPLAVPTPPSSSPTSCARRSGSCLVIPKLPLVVRPSSFTLPFAWISVA